MGTPKKSRASTFPPMSPPKQRRKDGDGATGAEDDDGGGDDERARFLSYYRRSGLPHPDRWPDGSPVFVSASARAGGVKYDLPPPRGGRDDDDDDGRGGGGGGRGDDGGSGPSPFPLDGRPVRFSGPRFRGIIASRVRDVPYPPWPSDGDGGGGGGGRRVVGPERYFRGRSRQYQWTVRGAFLRRTRFDEVVTGQDFDRPFRNAPASSLVGRALDLLRGRLPETFECDLLGERPTFEHPLIAGCQRFRVDRPETTMTTTAAARVAAEDETGEIIEDTSLLGDPAVPSDSEGRRKFFARRENLERFHFEPGLVYTFDFFANFFSPARHRLEVTPFFSVDLAPYFNGYPIFMAMAKDKSSGEYIWATELWHRRLLEYDAKPGVVSRLLSFGGGGSNKKNPKSEERSR